MTLSLAGCNTRTTTTTANDIRFDSLYVDKTCHLLDNLDNPNCNLQIKFLFPVSFADQETLATLQRHFIRSHFGEPYEGLPPAAAVEQYVNDYIDEYKSMEEDFLAETKEDEAPGHEHDEAPGISAWFSWYEYSSNEILYNQNDLLCYAVSYENYTGGAHGAHAYRSHVIDLQTGLEMKENDLFTEGYQEDLARILVGKIAENNRAETPRELENQGFFSIDEIYPNNNFSIDDTGITYYFNEYEIAAYVIGMTRVHLTYDKLRHLLRPDHRIARLAGN
jgi:hypothetical protein